MDHLTNWLKYFSRHQIHIVNGDQLIEKPWVEIKKVEDFLGLRNEIGQDAFYLNDSTGFYCLEGVRIINLSSLTCLQSDENLSTHVYGTVHI